MISRMWIATGAIACGTGIAVIFGEGTPAWAAFALLAALCATITQTVLSRPRGGTTRVQKTAQPPRVSSTEMIDQFFGLVPEREIEWLRTVTFDAPWPARQETTLYAIALFDGARTIPDNELRDAVSRLVNATEDFLRLYNRTTVYDPMVRDASWRTLGRTDEDGTVRTTDGVQEGKQHATLLTRAAGEICQSYDDLCLVAGRATHLV